MLFGTIFGVIIVPGLYYIFGTLAHGRKLIHEEENSPLTESIIKERSGTAFTMRIQKLYTKITKRNGNKKNS
jgi:HAE1 family hydrophobic/amphiphilic exporter-1